jgi:hypothetical protein
MDDIVKAALKKWPNVPHVYGWLGLDVRGDWWLRDERAQAAGGFPAVKGSRIEHEKLREFIERNYDHDDGCWFFQNGPQRVYVELEAAPFVWRLHPAGAAIVVRGRDGAPARVQTAWLDENGRMFLASERGLGIVHSQDIELASNAIESGTWCLGETHFDELPDRFGYRLSPAARKGTANASGGAAAEGAALGIRQDPAAARPPSSAAQPP